MTAYSTFFVIVSAVPLGILLSRQGARRIRNVVLAVTGFAQALPPYGVLVLIAFAPAPFGFNPFSVIVGLVAAALLPVLRNTVVGLRQVALAPFYDAGNAYVGRHALGPVAQAVGVGLRLDVAWLSFVERTTLRLDVARTLYSGAPTQSSPSASACGSDWRRRAHCRSG